MAVLDVLRDILSEPAILVGLLALIIDWLGRLVELAATPRGIA